MKLVETLTKYPSLMYVMAGALVGLFIGYQILPKQLPRDKGPIPAEELQSLLAVQQQLEAKLAISVLAIDGVEDAKVQLPARLSGSGGYNRASVTVASPSTLSDTKLAAIAELVASGVHGLESGNVIIIDAVGRTLNLRSVQQHAVEKFWTDIAINVSKIIGIIAALITVRYIVQAIHKKLLGESSRC